MMGPDSTFTSEQLTALQAIADRIIPEDDYPSATQAGAVDFVIALLSTDLVSMKPIFTHGLNMLNRESRARAGGDFVELPPLQQDALISNLVRQTSLDGWKVSPAQFMRLIISVVSEGYYADPQNGGNNNAVSWQMIGFEVNEGMRLFPETKSL